MLASVYIYKKVRPSVETTIPTVDYSITKQTIGDFEWDNIGINYIIKCKYFNSGLNYKITLHNIDVTKDIIYAKNFKKLGSRIIINFEDNEGFEIIGDEELSLYDFAITHSETEGIGLQKTGFIYMTRDTFDLITHIHLGH